MIKSLLQKLFSSVKKQNEIEVKEPYEFKLEKGKVQSIFAPELETQKNLVLTKWYFKPGDIIKTGAILCTIENKNIAMEFESSFSGEILSTCPINTHLTKGLELIKIKGI